MGPNCHHYRPFGDALWNFDIFNIIFIHAIFAQFFFCELNLACWHTTTIDVDLATVLDSICHLQGQVTIVYHKNVSQSEPASPNINFISSNVCFLPVVILLTATSRSEEHMSELQSPCNLVCRLLL